MIERYKERTGQYPERVLVDKIYRTRENLKYCKQHNIRLSGPAQVLRLINAERDKYGLSPLVQDSGATQVAHLRAKEIVQSFSHTRPNGSSCFTAAGELGVTYRSAGENIAYGFPTPEAVVNGWMNSEGHRKNILSSSFGKIGIGCYESGGVLYWSQFFIG